MAREGGEGALRRGWTTGACAAAAARAAYAGLLAGGFPDPVTIALPGGLRPSFALAVAERRGDAARAGVIKDAGDDPDVTHGALIIADVAPLAPGEGVRFAAGEGVGTVTLPGLPLAVGEPAINPVPRAMIRTALDEIARDNGLAAADARVTISVPGGAALSAKTMNARLGILGGLSILGTTGIVVPYSCAAWIQSIHRGIDVARAAGIAHIAASTGSVSEAAVQRRLALPDVALIDMGDFAGGMLKYLRRHPVPRLTLAGGFGKLAKLAAGHLDLHSSRSRLDLAALAELLRAASAPDSFIDEAGRLESGGALLARLGAVAPDRVAPFVDRVARGARETALATLAGGIAVDVMIFDRQGALLGHA
jgi:cobalt-precorrin-5B (C1)-methyltransferase